VVQFSTASQRISGALLRWLRLSKTSTPTPWRASCIAADKPDKPPPTMRTFMSLRFERAQDHHFASAELSS